MQLGFNGGSLFDSPLPTFSADEPLSAIEDRLLKREGYLFSPEKKARPLRPFSVIERELAPVRPVVRQNAGGLVIANGIVLNRGFAISSGSHRQQSPTRRSSSISRARQVQS